MASLTLQVFRVFIPNQKLYSNFWKGPVYWDFQSNSLRFNGNIGELIWWYLIMIGDLFILVGGNCLLMLVFQVEERSLFYKAYTAYLGIICLLVCCLGALLIIFGRGTTVALASFVRFHETLLRVTTEAKGPERNTRRREKRTGSMIPGMLDIYCKVIGCCPLVWTLGSMFLKMDPYTSLARVGLGSTLLLDRTFVGYMLINMICFSLNYMGGVEVGRHMSLGLIIGITYVTGIHQSIKSLKELSRYSFPNPVLELYGQLGRELGRMAEFISNGTFLIHAVFILIIVGGSIIIISLRNQVPLVIYGLVFCTTLTVSLLMWYLYDMVSQSAEETKELLREWKHRTVTLTRYRRKVSLRQIEALRPIVVNVGFGSNVFFRCIRTTKSAFYEVLLNFIVQGVLAYDE